MCPLSGFPPEPLVPKDTSVIVLDGFHAPLVSSALPLTADPLKDTANEFSLTLTAFLFKPPPNTVDCP